MKNQMENPIEENPVSVSFPNEEEINNVIKDVKKDSEEIPKKKRGRPKGNKVDKEKEQKFALVITQAFSNLVKFPFDFLADRRGDFWRLKPAEEQSLVLATQGIAEKYIPDIIEAWSDELFFLITFSVIIYPRVMEDLKVQKELEEKKKKQAQNLMDNADTKE